MSLTAIREAAGVRPTRQASSAGFVANPFLHLSPARIYNPLTDRSLNPGDAGWEDLGRVLAGLSEDDLPAEPRRILVEQGWLVPREEDLSTHSFLKYVSLEAHTVCNQSCYFCPVSIAPREDYFMPTETYERIVGELAAYRATIEAVFMINYNEPTVDRRFLDQVATLLRAGLPPAVLTNASGLTPARIDALVAMGGLRYLSVNLSTLDRDRYLRDRGIDQLEMVLRHVTYAGDKPVARDMDLVVLGTGDETHQRDFAAIRQRFAGSRFNVKSFEVMDRAGYLQIGLKPTLASRRLGGCENNGSRPLQHLHITPRGLCVFCCEDYDEAYVVGDLNQASVAETLRGPALAQLRRFAYGIDEAPADFICRKCIFALHHPKPA